MPQPEALFKQKLCRFYAQAFPQGWYQYNLTQLKRGVPDLAFQLPSGVVLWVEAKMAPKHASPVQRLVQQQMVHAGARVVVLQCVRAPQGRLGAFYGVTPYTWGRTSPTKLHLVRHLALAAELLAASSTWFTLSQL